MQPIQSAIESLQAEGVCPRLHVDATHEDTVVPDFVSEKWGHQLVIDLDPAYPLELEFTEVGVEANLSFGGYVTRCTFAWAAIFIVAERGTQRGRVFEGNVPGPLRSRYAPGAVDPTLTKAEDKDRRPGRRRKRRRPAKEPAAVVELAAAPDNLEESQDEAEAEADETKTDQQEVKSRRSAFTVIDGGS